MERMKIQTGAFAGLMILAVASAGAVELYMAPDGDDRNDGSSAKPVKTLERAMLRVRAIERDEPKTIVVRDGTYAFEKPVILNSGDYDITIRAEHPGKAIFTGAMKVSGWKKDDEDEKLLVADLPFEPKAGMRLSLASSGKWCDIASYPDFPNGKTLKLKSNPGTDHLAYDGDMDFSEIDLKSAWLVIPQEYSTTVTAVKEYDAENRIFTLATPTGMPFDKFNQGFRILNTRHGLRKPGMWMYETSKNRLVYWPREGETAENLDVSLSKAHSILALHNSNMTHVEGLVFEGCARDPEHTNPYTADPNAAISMTAGQRSVIDNCEVRNCAGPGIFACKPMYCLVTRCHVHHMGAECVNYHDGGDASDVMWSDLHDNGLLGVTMALGMQLSNCKCVGNKIHDSPACGAVMWAANSIFASNELWHCMFASADGGGLYGGFNNSKLFDNYVHDIGNWSGLYADEGSQNVIYYNNRFENCWWPIHLHCTQNVTISNNVFRNDSPMRWSYQSSGHGIFCDNKMYTLAKPESDPYQSNCDFWGRNEFFLKQPDGSYKSAGMLTLPRPRPEPAKISLPAIPEKGVLPIDLKGRVNWDAFTKETRYSGRTSIGVDGFSSVGVPDAGVQVAYDDLYLYVGVQRAWNALCGYPAMQNFTSTGWGHCDAARIHFEGGRTLTFFPNGKWELSDKTMKVAKDDVQNCGGGSFVARIPLESLKIKGAKRKLEKLDLDTEDDGMMLTDEAESEMRGPEKKLPKPQDVLDKTLKFNVAIWVEDLREEKALFAHDSKDYATGTITFAKPMAKKR